MTKKSRVVGDEGVLTAKAIRRGEKLERTLTKLVVIQEAGSPAEAFLKAVQKGLAQLRKEETPSDAKPAARKKAAAGKAKPAAGAARRAPSPRKAVRKPKAPAKSPAEAGATASETTAPATES
jgi:hypothetical protein